MGPHSNIYIDVIDTYLTVTYRLQKVKERTFEDVSGADVMLFEYQPIPMTETCKCDPDDSPSPLGSCTHVPDAAEATTTKTIEIPGPVATEMTDKEGLVTFKVPLPPGGEYGQYHFRISFPGNQDLCPANKYLTVNVNKLYTAVVGDPPASGGTNGYMERNGTFNSAQVIAKTHLKTGDHGPCALPGETFTIKGRLVVLYTDKHGVEQQLLFGGKTVKLWQTLPQDKLTGPSTYTYTGKSTTTDSAGNFEFTGLTVSTTGDHGFVVQYLGDNLHYCTGSYGGWRGCNQSIQCGFNGGQICIFDDTGLHLNCE